MLARAVACGAPGAVNPQRLGIIGRQPARRRRRRRAQDRLDAAPPEDFDRLVEQREIELSLARLENVPGKLAQARGVEPGRRHALGVALPITLVDVFGIVRRAEQKRVGLDRTPNGNRQG